MHCTQCGTKFRPDDKFCAKCGTPAAAVQRRPQERTAQGAERPARNQERTARGPFSNAEGVAQYDALLAKKQARAARIARVVVLVIWGGWAVLALLNSLSAKGFASYLLTSGVIALVLTAFSLCWVSGPSLSEREYYAFTGSRNSAGEHQCIHCGHRGVYIKGQYRTNLQHHNCSKCKKYLYTT